MDLPSILFETVIRSCSAHHFQAARGVYEQLRGQMGGEKFYGLKWLMKRFGDVLSEYEMCTGLQRIRAYVRGHTFKQGPVQYNANRRGVSSS